MNLAIKVPKCITNPNSSCIE